MKVLMIIFSLLLVLLLAGLWVGPGSYPDRWRTEQRIAAQQLQNQERKESIKKIEAELKDVDSAKDAIEERARNEFGMMKKGETFYEVTLNPPTTTEQAHTQKKHSLDKNTPLTK